MPDMCIRPIRADGAAQHRATRAREGECVRSPPPYPFLFRFSSPLTGLQLAKSPSSLTCSTHLLGRTAAEGQRGVCAPLGHGGRGDAWPSLVCLKAERRRPRSRGGGGRRRGKEEDPSDRERSRRRSPVVREGVERRRL